MGWFACCAASVGFVCETPSFATQHPPHNNDDDGGPRQVPAGFNKFEAPAISNAFYGDGIPFGKVTHGRTPPRKEERTHAHTYKQAFLPAPPVYYTNKTHAIIRPDSPPTPTATHRS